MIILSHYSVYSQRAAGKELGARRVSFLADRPTKSTHKEQKILSIWLDFSPFCLQWKLRHGVLSSLTGFEWEAVFRRVDPGLVLSTNFGRTLTMDDVCTPGCPACTCDCPTRSCDCPTCSLVETTGGTRGVEPPIAPSTSE